MRVLFFAAVFFLAPFSAPPRPPPQIFKQRLLLLSVFLFSFSFLFFPPAGGKKLKLKPPILVPLAVYAYYCIRFVYGRAAVVAPVAGEEETQSEEQLSALRDNLARKGKNSYYYAHNR